jgi:DNA repair protein RecO (recombination protein O)
MIAERSSGIILRVRPLTDTSLIVHWLCADLGRIGTVAKGARAAKSTFAGKLDTGFEAQFGFVRSVRSDLHSLREVLVQSMNTGLRSDYPRLAQWAYGVTLLEALTETDTPLPEVHQVVSGFLHYLAGALVQPRTVIALEVRLLSVLGLEPEMEGDAGALLRELADLPWEGLSQIEAPTAAIRRLKGGLQRTLQTHLGRLPRGRAEAVGG